MRPFARKPRRSPRSRPGALAVALGLAVAPVLAAAPPADAASTLRSLAEAQNRYIGTELTGNMVNNSTITSLAGTQFDMVTPGNEMKWDTTEPANGAYNFGPGDNVVSFAQSHTMRVRGHNLVWHASCPAGSTACRATRSRARWKPTSPPR